MPARWKTGLALLALAIAAPLRAQPLSAPPVINRCAAQADAKLNGISALEHACPGLRNAFDQLRLSAFLPPDWPNTLTGGELADLDALLRRYAGPPASEPPKTAALRSIAARLVAASPPPTWWSRIMAWIEHRTGSLLPSVRRWLRSVAPSLQHHGQAWVYGIMVLLLAAVVAVLAFELRGAGLIRPRRGTTRLPRRTYIAGGPTGNAEAQSREPDWARLREQPARVLRLLVDTLTRAHRLGRERHLTCRELESEARFDTETERAGFARVARLAERELYGPPGATVLSEEALRDAMLLHTRLLAAAQKGGDLRQ